MPHFLIRFEMPIFPIWSWKWEKWGISKISNIRKWGITPQYCSFAFKLTNKIYGKFLIRIEEKLIIYSKVIRNYIFKQSFFNYLLIAFDPFDHHGDDPSILLDGENFWEIIFLNYGSRTYGTFSMNFRRIFYIFWNILKFRWSESIIHRKGFKFLVYLEVESF